MDALVRSRVDLATSGTGSDRIWLDACSQARDLATLLLVDVSLSTDAWIDGRRVLDVEKEALTAGLRARACGDAFAIHTFSSRTRREVKVEAVKSFEERIGEPVRKRIAALRPGQYTRIGAALRHATSLLSQRPERHRLLLLLSDGKPNDLDHYEGRHGIEDTRKAVLEARGKGCRCSRSPSTGGPRATCPSSSAAAATPWWAISAACRRRSPASTGIS